MRSLTLIARTATLLVCATALAGTAYAQDTTVPQAPPAHFSFVQGTVTVDHGGDSRGGGASGQESEPAAINMPVVEGDRVVTGPNGRAEIMFPDGSAIEIEPASNVEIIGPTRVRVIAGAIEHRAAPPLDPRSPSAQNLPPDLQPYGPDLDQNGAWQYEPQYGNVWYPTTIAADWRPYYDGYWYSAPAYGYTWIGSARWAWPTHHYGRWGYASNRWFWIPGRSYASAWVSWGTAPGYVGWCPLGWDSRPVFALSAGYRNTWNGWTVMNRDHFGYRGYSPRRYGVDPSRIASNVAFVEHRTPPSREPRGSLSVAGPSRSSGNSVGTAVPRYSSGERRAPSDERRETSNERRVPGNERRAPGNEPRATTVAPITPTPTLPQSNQTDHPAYRPRYQPRYEPQGEPAPPAGYRDRRVGGDGTRATTGQPAQPAQSPQPAQPRAQERERPAPRTSAPPPAPAPASAPPPPAAAAPRGGSERGSTPPRERRPR